MLLYSFKTSTDIDFISKFFRGIGKACLFLWDFNIADTNSGVFDLTFIPYMVVLEILNFLRHQLDVIPIITRHLLFELLDPAGSNLSLE
jgi:hypothetical protein